MRGQGKENAPLNPLILRTSLYGEGLVSLQIVSDKMKVTATLELARAGFMGGTVYTSLPIEDSAKIGEAIQAAADSLRDGKQFLQRTVGVITVAIGMGKVKEEEKEQPVVIVSSGSGGFLSSPFAVNLPPANADEMAKGLRAAPGIYARLKSAVNFDAIHKAP